MQLLLQRMNSAITFSWTMQSFNANGLSDIINTADPKEPLPFSSSKVMGTNHGTKPNFDKHKDSRQTKNGEGKAGNSENSRVGGNRTQGRQGVKPHGSSRRSRLKKAFLQEQVSFTSPLRENPHVAILGGGMSGLICALTLEERGIRSTVFDTGIHGLGGRMGTRQIDPHPLIFDHAAQFFTVSDPRFKNLVDGWVSKGAVKEWNGQLCNLHPGGQFTPLPPAVRYIGTNGMRPLADSLLAESRLVNIVRPCWISRLEPFNGLWHLTENGNARGEFDSIVIAHNGVLKFCT